MPLNLRGKSLLVALIPLLMLVASVLSVHWSMRFTATAEDNVQRSIKALSQIHAVHALLAEGASAVRGYLYTNDASFLQPYWRAVREMDGALQAMADVVRDPQQRELVSEITRLVNIKMNSLDTLRQKAELERSAPLRQVLVDDKVLLDLLREKIAEMEVREQEIIDQYTQTVTLLRERNLLIATLAAALGIFTAVAASLWFSSSLVRRVRQIGDNARRLVDGAAQLPFQASSDELGQLADSIQTAGELLSARASEAQSARLEAEVASQAKTEFLSRVSHELRTPLNAILGFAQLLEQDLAGRPEQRSVQLIHSSGHHLLQLVNDVLDISRIEAGNLVMASNPLALRPLLEEAVAMTRSLALSQGITLQPVRLPPEVTDLPVLADRHRLLQVLLNLLSNAVKYNRPGGEVQVVVTVLPDDRVQVAVRDTGPGVAPELRDKLFTPFVRAVDAGVEGTGLGLAVSKSLIEAMGGDIDWQALSPCGSEFRIRLPRHADAIALPAAPVVERPAPAVSPLPAADQPRTVLCIEDNPSNQLLIQNLVARVPGWRLLLADNAQAGLALLAQAVPDLVLLDLALPDLPGEEVLRRIRAQHDQHTLPVVMVSADALPEKRAALLALGANDYLVKPIDIPTFLALFARPQETP